MIQYSNMIGIIELLLVIILFVIPIVVAVGIIRKRKNHPDVVKDEPKTKEVHTENIATISDEQNVRSVKILRERLAKGEISKKEYDELKKEFE